MEATLRLNREDEGELVESLENLYGWWTKEIMEASYTKDLGRLEAVLSAIGEIRQAWEQLHDKQARSAGTSPAAFGDRVV